MALYPYVATLAVDPVTLVAAKGATGQIFAPADTSFASPLTATDATGNPIPLTANADGILPSFYATAPAVNWRSGAYVFPLVTSQPLEGPKGDTGERGNDGMDGQDGLPGVNAVPTADAVATYATTPGNPVNTALSATFVSLEGTDGIEVLKPSTDTRPGVWEWIHDSPSGYLFHLMTGVNNSAPIFGLGIDNGGTGIFINNKKTGKGISIQQNDSITSATAYGIYGSQKSKVAPLIHIDQEDGAQKSLRFFTLESTDEFREVVEVISPGGKGGYIAAKSGKIRWRSDIEAVSGARFVAKSNAVSTDADHVFVQNNAVRLATWNGAAGGFWQKRISQTGQSMSLELADGTSGGPDAVPAAWFKAVEAKQTNGLASGTQLGFFGSAPVTRRILSPAATDAATTQQLANNLRQALVDLGLAL